MAEWERILSDLMDIYDHYMASAAKAPPKSVERNTYSGYMQTITQVVDLIKEKLREEDDGK